MFDCIDRPFQASNWTGRIDAQEGKLGQRWHQQVSIYDESQALSLIGFCCDAGVARNQGRVGASLAPPVLRRVFGGLPAQPNSIIADVGDVMCDHDEMEAAQQRYANIITTLLHAGTIPIGLGGGHEIAYASFCGLRDYFIKNKQRPNIAIINLDAHLDLRIDNPPSSGTPFRQIAEDCHTLQWSFHYACLGVSRFANTVSLFERGQALGLRYIEDDVLTTMSRQEINHWLDDYLADKDYVYLTLDLDVLPAGVMPAVSAPAGFGVSLPTITYLLQYIINSGKVCLVDIAEYNPHYDQDDRGARVVARLMASIIESLLIKRK